MTDSVYFLIFWYSDIHRVSKEVEGRQKFLLLGLIMLFNMHSVSYWYYINVAFSFFSWTGDKIKNIGKH